MPPQGADGIHAGVTRSLMGGGHMAAVTFGSLRHMAPS